MSDKNEKVDSSRITQTGSEESQSASETTLNSEKTQSKSESAKSDQVDTELSELLDEALQDFGKARPTEDGEEGPEDMLFLDRDMAQRAAAEFQHMLEQMSSMQQAVCHQTQQGPPIGPLGNTSASGGLPVGELPPDFDPEMFQQEAKTLLESINSLAGKAKDVASAEDDQKFMENMDALQTEGIQNEFMPFMHQMMSSLLSKDVMYPSLKEMQEKYPPYLEENKASISASDLERYKTQNGLIDSICKEFESEKDDDTDEIRGQRFGTIVESLQKMQMCGYPPQELIGDLPPGWAVDPTSGLPTVQDSSAAADACSIM